MKDYTALADNQSRYYGQPKRSSGTPFVQRGGACNLFAIPRRVIQKPKEKYKKQKTKISESCCWLKTSHWIKKKQERRRLEQYQQRAFCYIAVHTSVLYSCRRRQADRRNQSRDASTLDY